MTGPVDFDSAPPPSGGGARLAAGAGAAPGAATNSPSASPSASSPPRTVQETDLYRLDGNRLYYLNSYRGLMVFDLTDVDHPKLLGRYAIFGSPVQMVVNAGIATVVVADWFGKTSNGDPFHGSIVQGLDATDPSNIKLLGQAPLGGWVRDTRVVGTVLYAVSEDQGWIYGWRGGPVAVAGGAGVGGVGVAPAGGGIAYPYYPNRDVIVSSVSFAGGQIQQVSSKTYSGYGGVFNVTPNSILLAHPAAPAQPNVQPPARTELEYLDISDPGGQIVERGKIQVDGSITGWGPDNGRWNLDFADGKTAHVLGCTGSVYSCGQGYTLAIADFSNPDKPAIASQLSIPAKNGWSPATRFDGTRMYLSPNGGYAPAGGASTPLEIYDLSNPGAPALAGQAQIPGSVWLMIPSGAQLFALGQDYNTNSSQVSLKYLDVSVATAPKLIGTSNFGDGWAWTPAASTFKAFTHDSTKGLVVVPFSGWSASAGKYNNGVQLIEFTPASILTAGAAHTTGWVERGIFANGRIVSLSDLALSVVDYTDPLKPNVTSELTLARNVIASTPSGSTIAQISSDWWGNDKTHSDVRVLPIADAAENVDESAAVDVPVPGVDARVFTNGSLVYVVTTQQVPSPCPVYQGPGPKPLPVPPVPAQQCFAWQEQVHVVDVSNGTAKARGAIALPIDPAGWNWYWGWGGFYYWDWFDGGEIAQVGGDILAFRRWHPNYGPTGKYIDESDSLYIVDLSNPDQLGVSSVVVTTDLNGWWGNMKVVGSTLYTTHYVWPTGFQPNAKVKYYLDAIDLTDRAHPVVKTKINVPGVLVGGLASDPTVLYTIDYRYYNGGTTQNDLNVVKLLGDKAYLQSRTALDGWVGNVFVRDNGTTAYMSTQLYVPNTNTSSMELHQIDLTNPRMPIDRIASGPGGWGWLVDVQGDRMLVTSGWGYWGDYPGLDIYRLSANAAPMYDQFVRTRGWSISSIARQDNQIFLSSGEWGVQVVNLK